MDQNEIDALMNGGGDPDDDGNDGASAQEGSGEFTQEDIDAAFSSADEDATGRLEGQELSQADIDAALSDEKESQEPAAQAASQPSAGEFSDETGFSQEDIDALMASAQSTADEAAAVAPSDSPQLDSEGRPLDELGAAMAAAIAEEQAAAEASRAASPATSSVPLQDVELPTFDDDEIAQEAAQPVSILHDVELHVKIELGRTHMYVEDVLQLSEGSVVELDRLAGDPVDVYVNNRLVARGEVLVLNDNFCVRVSEIVSAAADARLVG